MWIYRRQVLRTAAYIAAFCAFFAVLSCIFVPGAP
jgi:preprotein translocase subunit SecE